MQHAHRSIRERFYTSRTKTQFATQESPPTSPATEQAAHHPAKCTAMAPQRLSHDFPGWPFPGRTTVKPKPPTWVTDTTPKAPHGRVETLLMPTRGSTARRPMRTDIVSNEFGVRITVAPVISKRRNAARTRTFGAESSGSWMHPRFATRLHTKAHWRSQRLEAIPT